MVTQKEYKWVWNESERMIIENAVVEHMFDDHYKFTGKFFLIRTSLYVGQKIPYNYMNWKPPFFHKGSYVVEKDDILEDLKDYIEPCGWWSDFTDVFAFPLKQTSAIWRAQDLEVFDHKECPLLAYQNSQKHIPIRRYKNNS